MKKTLVIGASSNTNRYSYRATGKLIEHGHEVELIGLKAEKIFGVEIQKGLPDLENIDTVTLYLGAVHQVIYYDYIVDLKPTRVIFNPGTENPEFYSILEKNSIPYIEACTLVLLSIGDY